LTTAVISATRQWRVWGEVVYGTKFGRADPKGRVDTTPLVDALEICFLFHGR